MYQIPPPEIWYQILNNLNMRSFMRFHSTNRHYRYNFYDVKPYLQKYVFNHFIQTFDIVTKVNILEMPDCVYASELNAAINLFNQVRNNLFNNKWNTTKDIQRNHQYNIRPNCDGLSFIVNNKIKSGFRYVFIILNILCSKIGWKVYIKFIGNSNLISYPFKDIHNSNLSENWLILAIR